MLLNSQVMGTAASRWTARRDVDAQTGQWKRCQANANTCCCSRKSQNSGKLGLRWMSQIHVRFLDELLSLTSHLIGRAVVVWSALRLNVGNSIWKKPQSSPSCEEPCEHGVVRDVLHRQVVHQSCTAVLSTGADRESGRGAHAGETSTDWTARCATAWSLTNDGSPCSKIAETSCCGIAAISVIDSFKTSVKPRVTSAVILRSAWALRGCR